MINPQISNAAGPRLVSVQIRLHDHELLAGDVPLVNGQSLASYVAKDPSSVILHNATRDGSEEKVTEQSVQTSEIVWVRTLDLAAPLVPVAPPDTENRWVEVVLSNGDVLHGELMLPVGRELSDLLASTGEFLPLWRGRSDDSEQQHGDLLLNRAAIQTVREVAASAEPHDQETVPAATLHWLVRVARRAGLAGARSLALRPGASIAQVWNMVCSTAGIDQNELVEVVAAQLRLPVADLAAAQPEAAGTVGSTIVERYGVRVLSDDGRTLTVATADPMDADAEQALAFAAKRRVAFAVASPSALGIFGDDTPDQEPDVEMLLSAMSDGAAEVRVEDERGPQEIEVEDVSAEPIIKLANLVLREAVRQGASDIHLEPDRGRGIVRFRVDGMLRPYMHVPLTALNRVISRYKVIARLDIADRVRPQDGRVRIRVEGRRYELRLSTVPTQDAEKAVLRIAGTVQEQTLDQLMLPARELAVLRQLLSHRDGIVVVTGPTGSGKTTTLYGALNELNTGKINIMTVEDPIERALAGTTQIQVQPKAGVTFASALRAILRQDPDIILVGEIRDLETAEIAVQAAMTGHLVLTTLHTTSSVGVVSRLRDLGLDGSTLAAALRGIVAQRLARRSCTDCHDGAGCDSCEGTGYRGRLPVMEVLAATPQFTELIGRGAGFHELQRAAIKAGMRPIRETAEARVAAGETSLAEIQRVLGGIEEEAQAYAAAEAAALPAGSPHGVSGATNIARLPAGPQENVSGLPSRYNPADWTPNLDTPARRRAEAARALLQGLDRCIAEGQGLAEVMQFACNQLSAAFESPLVWIGTLEQGAFSMRARAGACAPYVRDIVAQWDDAEAGDGAIATALRTGEPQARHIDKEPGFDSWREHARTYGLPIFLALPMEGQHGPLGVVGVHVRGVDGLDAHAGQELVSLVDRIAGALERLRQLEAVQLQLSALESAADAVFTTDRRGVIQWVNKAFVQLTGYAASEAVGQPARMLRSDRHDAQFFRSLWDSVLAGRPWRGELHNRRKDGSVIVVEQTITPVTNDRGEVNCFLSVQRDISERKQREESVQSLVNHDPTTGLPNARALDVELGRAVAEAAEEGREYALLLIHLNGSASVRDEIGPTGGDQFVCAVAEVLRDALRPGDYLARLGDDEFAALLPDTPPEGVVIAADRLCAKVTDHRFDIAELPASPSISIGIAPVDGSEGPRAVLAMADTALYGSREWKDRVVVSQRVDNTFAADGDVCDSWGERIRAALRDDQFFLHFQPVVRLDNRTVSHFDAMIRLHDDDGDVVPARAFISHAERLGLTPQLDRWVVENVLRLLHMSPGLSVSLNISALTLASAQFRQFMQRQKRSLSAVAGRIIFEVSEVGAARDLARAQDSMTRLTELGCRFTLDNFGISGGSLASLGGLPVDYVKLDGSLVRGIASDASARELVQALTTVARALGKEVIAGWAESESIVELLPQLGIGLAQGHHLGRPSRELRAAVGERFNADGPSVAVVATSVHTQHPGTNGHHQNGTHS